MKKLICKKATEVEALLWAATNQQVHVEDRVYLMRPLKWYTHEPWYGLRSSYYIEDACDCDDRCTILQYRWLRKHLKDAEAGQSTHGNMSYPALPVFRAKLKLHGEATPHWVMLVLHTNGIAFVERTEGRIRELYPSRVERILEVRG